MGRLHLYSYDSGSETGKNNGRKLPSDMTAESYRRRTRALMLEAIRSGQLKVPEEYLKRLLEG